MSNTPLRVNLQMLYRWSQFEHEYCQLCKGPVGYGALAEVYTPPPEKSDNDQTEAEAFQAADDYCNALADRQEKGDFTIYAMYPVCGACAARMMSEDVGGYAPQLLTYVRENPQEGLWIAACMHYEPGAYGRYQPFLIHGAPASLETIYAAAGQSDMSNEPRFELQTYPGDEPHRHAKTARRSSPRAKKRRGR
jgi:hypothetical protein